MSRNNVIYPGCKCYRIGKTLKKLGLIRVDTFYNFVFKLKSFSEGGKS